MPPPRRAGCQPATPFSRLAARVVLCLAFAGAGWSQPARPLTPGQSGFDPYKPLSRQLPLSRELLDILQGVHLSGGLDAAAAPGAVTLKPHTETTVPPSVSQRFALMLARLRNGDQSSEVMNWLRELSADTLTALIEKTPRTHSDHVTSDALVDALLHGRPGFVDQPERLLPLCALRTAQFLGARSDARCEPLFKTLLNHQPEKESIAIPAVLGLAEYYRGAGDYVKSAHTFLAVKDYTNKKATLANCAIEAARSYMRAGKETEAEKLYQEVPRYGYGWATGMAVCERAQLRIRHGRYDEARAMLSEPFTDGPGRQLEVGRLYLRGVAAFLAGNLDTAISELTQCVDYYEHSLHSSIVKGEGLRGVVSAARGCLRWTERWKKSPIYVSRKSAVLYGSDLEATPTWRCAVVTYRPSSLSASCDADWATVSLSPAQRTNCGWERKLTISVRSGFTPASARNTATVTVATADPKRVALRLPAVFHFHHHFGIQVTPSTLFAGETALGKPLRCSVLLRGKKAFDIVGVQVTAPLLTDAHATVSRLDRDGLRWKLEVEGAAPAKVRGATGQSIRGTIAVEVLESQRRKVIRVPLFGFVKSQ